MTHPTDTAKSEELKPADCPFCGDDQSSFAGMTEGAFAKGPESFHINCECGAMGPGGASMDEAIAAWNRRSSPPQNDAGGVYAKDRDKIAALIDPGIFKRELPKRHDDARRAQAYRKADEIIAALRAPMSELQALGQEFEAGDTWRKHYDAMAKAAGELKAAIRPQLDAMPYADHAKVRKAFNDIAVVAGRALDFLQGRPLPSAPSGEGSDHG